MNLTRIKEILEHEKLAPLKKLGQNFLINPHIAEKIVDLAGIGPDDTVVELGVGLGTLTAPLARRASQVIGIEIDAGIISWQESEGNLADNVHLRHQDLLKADFPELADRCGGRLRIVANLPYSVSNPLLFKLLDNREVMEWAVLMLQKEVGMRLVAQPPGKEYGILSVLYAGAADVRHLLDVGPGQFFPRPKVDSVVVKIIFYPPPARVVNLPAHDSRLLKRIVKSAFGQRRKTLLNALSSSPPAGLNKEALRGILTKAGIDPGIRAERLGVEDYVRLANEVAAAG